jgi:hypothetical protein
MSRYEDDTILLDDTALTIASYRRPGDARRVEYGSIRSFQIFEMGFWTGRHRLVGISLGRPRNWIHWGRNRGDKRTAISLDVGAWIRPTIVPDDAEAVAEILYEAVGTE